MNQLWGVLGALALAGGCIAGCGAKTEGGPGGGTPVDEAGFPTALADAVCNNVEPCCGQRSLPYNRTACLNAVHASISPNTNPLLTYDAATAGTCVARVHSAVAACRDPWSAIVGTRECQRLYQGTVPLGQACMSDAECAPNDEGEVYCGTLPNSFGATTCLLAAGAGGHLAAGDPCTGNWYCDEQGFDCFFISGGSVVPGTAGTNGCYYLDGLNCGPSQTCEPLAPAGGACSDGFGCVMDAYCSTSPTDPSPNPIGTCVALPRQGEACSSQSYCAEGLSCVCPSDMLNCDTGICQPPGGAGAPCEPFSSTQCAEGLFCLCPDAEQFCVDPGTCTARVGLGSACGAADQCSAGLYCDGTVCQSLPKFGESCSVMSALPCGQGSCYPGGINRCVELDADPPELASCAF